MDHSTQTYHGYYRSRPGCVYDQLRSDIETTEVLSKLYRLHLVQHATITTHEKKANWKVVSVITRGCYTGSFTLFGFTASLNTLIHTS